MKTSSAKAKGRRLQNEVAERLRAWMRVGEADIRPAIMGEKGSDIKMSKHVQRAFPFAVECKNQERLHVWSALEQAEKHAKGHGTLKPLLIFRRNRSATYAVLKLDDLLEHIEYVEGSYSRQTKPEAS